MFSFKYNMSPFNYVNHYITVILFSSCSGGTVVFVRKIGRKFKDVQEVGPDLSAAAAAGDDRSCDVSESLRSQAGVIQKAEDHTERSSDMCVGPGKQDIIIIFTRRLFTQPYT